MKTKNYGGLILFFIFLLGAGWPRGTHAVELTTEFSMGNLFFPPNGTETDTTFTGSFYPWGVSLYAEKDINEQISVEGGFYQDPILQNIASARFTYHGQYFSLTGGPFFGTFNTAASYLKPGLSTEAEIRLPGILFIQGRADTSIGVRMVENGDYIQESNLLALGYYIPNAKCRAYLSTRKFVEKKENWEQVDGITDYMFETDIFKKNVPYHIILTLGYRELFRSFLKPVADDVTLKASALILGTRFDYAINEYISFSIDLESNVYAFPQEDLTAIELAWPEYLFKGTLGLTIDTDVFNQEETTEIIFN